ncbi:endonuclease/exonuclease/phosphatase family protein [Brevibacillus fluminis]|uniref:endonuclease/exonuclease/phosphatase family protein n=1 Tax=Brevibacillus fluminis TaxID=511487 RepID=UPI001FE41D4B|nr:endonuclease/exonuclease/phosphatase family protein [Brevibacillus fluminis]
MLRIASYNIHSGKDMFWRNRLDAMADVLAQSSADLIGLQEVHQNSRMGFQAAYLAERLHYVYAFAPALAIADGQFGNALLSRFPLTSAESIRLPATREPRMLLYATVPACDREISIMVTHCSLDKTSRLQQLQYITGLVAEKKDTPLLLLGDFNSSSVTFHPDLVDCAVAMNQTNQSTLVPIKKRLDYIFASTQWSIKNYTVLRAKCSDHYPLLVTLELPEQLAPAK